MLRKILQFTVGTIAVIIITAVLTIPGWLAVKWDITLRGGMTAPETVIAATGIVVIVLILAYWWLPIMAYTVNRLGGYILRRLRLC